MPIFGRIRTSQGKGRRRRSPSPEKKIEAEDRIGDIEPSIIIRIRGIKAVGRTPGEEEIAYVSDGIGYVDKSAPVEISTKKDRWGQR